MLFFQHEGLLFYSAYNYQGRVLNIDDFQPGAGLMDLLCDLGNLGIDGKKFIKNYMELLKRNDDKYVNSIKELGLSLETMDNRVENALLFAAIAVYGKFTGCVLNSYLIHCINNKIKREKNLDECTPDEIAQLFMDIHEVICESIDRITSWINSLFYDNRIDSGAKELFNQQSIRLRILPLENGLVSVYEIDDYDIASVLLYAYKDYLSSGKKICTCKNCNRWFIPTLRKEEVYCTHINNNGKTCKEIGYENTMDNTDKAYRKAYKTKNAFKNRNKDNKPSIQDDFDRWVETAKIMKQQVRNGDITETEYYSFLDSKI